MKPGPEKFLSRVLPVEFLDSMYDEVALKIISRVRVSETSVETLVFISNEQIDAARGSLGK